MSLDFELISSQIKKFRMQQQMSQAELAERIDMSVSFISKIESVKKQASLEALVRICNELGTTMNELLGDNQIHYTGANHTDIEHLMSDCSNTEKRLLLEFARAAKGILRDEALSEKFSDNKKSYD